MEDFRMRKEKEVADMKVKYEAELSRATTVSYTPIRRFIPG